MIRIVADRNIERIEETFQGLGEIQLYEGRDIPRKILEGADVLLCRSTVKVDEELLKGTNIRFVATATSGSEHVNQEYTSSEGIVFANAAGSNARSVAEYVFTSLYSLAVNKSFSLLDKSIGIIGVGRVGTWIEHIAKNLGMKIFLNDPPKALRTKDPALQSIDKVLEADIVTLHPILTSSGDFPTFHLLNKKRFDQLAENAIFINTSRGGVVDTSALLNFAEYRPHQGMVVDVYENEPDIDMDIFQYADIATSHIAGYSYDGRLLGTQMIYEALCSYLHIEPVNNYLDVLPALEPIKPIVDLRTKRLDEMIYAILKQIYDVRLDDRALRKILLLPASQRPSYFDYLRSNYRVRREFPAYKLIMKNLPEEVRFALMALGFQRAD